jgi:hypothetical protein
MGLAFSKLLTNFIWSLLFLKGICLGNKKLTTKVQINYNLSWRKTKKYAKGLVLIFFWNFDAQNGAGILKITYELLTITLIFESYYLSNKKFTRVQINYNFEWRKTYIKYIQKGLTLSWNFDVQNGDSFSQNY